MGAGSRAGREGSDGEREGGRREAEMMIRSPFVLHVLIARRAPVAIEELRSHEPMRSALRDVIAKRRKLEA